MKLLYKIVLACFLSVGIIFCAYIRYEKEFYQYLIETISDYRANNTNAETSVLMPTYNRVDLLPNAIDSILEQSYKNFELIILDDGSDIENWNLLFDYIKKDNRVRVYFNKENKGRAYSRNRLFNLAKGKYLAIMDDDDISYPNRLEEQIAYMKNKNVDVCFAAAKRNGEIWKSYWYDELIDIRLIYLMFTCPFVHVSMVINKDFLDKTGIKYNEDYIAEDYNLYYDFFVHKAKFGFVAKYLLDIRMHHTNPEEYYKQQLEDFYEVKKRFQTMFLGNDEKLHAASFCDRLSVLKEWNKKTAMFKDENIDKIYNKHKCNTK